MDLLLLANEASTRPLMSFAEWTYVAYACISIAITIWVARTLFHNGRIFLIDSFLGNQPLADSVNKLLVVGFYLVNFGFVFMFLSSRELPTNMRESIEFLTTKVGIVLLVLGGMHFVNIIVFSKARARAMLRHAPPPVEPTTRIAPVVS